MVVLRVHTYPTLADGWSFAYTVVRLVTLDCTREFVTDYTTVDSMVDVRVHVWT